MIEWRNFVAKDYHLFTALKQTFGSHKHKNDCEVETALTGPNDKGNGLLSSGNKTAHLTIKIIRVIYWGVHRTKSHVS